MKTERNLYSDTDNVVASLREATEKYDECEVSMTVVDAGCARMVALTEETVEERNLRGTEFGVEDHICTLSWPSKRFGSLAPLDLTFHESEVEATLEVTPAGARAIDPRQATDPRELGPRLKRALDPVVDEFDATFTFAEVSAASVANGGHYTDFEYEYSIDGITGL